MLLDDAVGFSDSIEIEEDLEAEIPKIGVEPSKSMSFSDSIEVEDEELEPGKFKLPDLMPAHEPTGVKPEEAKPKWDYGKTKVDDYFYEFMNNVVDAFTLGALPAEEAPIGRTDLPGSSAVRTAGKVIGNIPITLIGAGLINTALRAAAARLSVLNATSLIYGSRIFFTGAAAAGLIKESVDFKEAYEAGNVEGMEEAASSAIIDGLFTALMARGWYKDAKMLKDIVGRRKAAYEMWKAGEGKGESPKIAEKIEPSPEFKSRTEATDVMAEVDSRMRANAERRYVVEDLAPRGRMPAMFPPEKYGLKKDLDYQINRAMERIKIAKAEKKGGVPKPEDVSLLDTEIPPVMREGEVPDRSQIEQTPEDLPLVTNDELVAEFGEDWDELPDEQIKAWLRERAKKGTYYHVTPTKNVESIEKAGFDISLSGTGVGLKRDFEAAGISLTDSQRLIDVYMRDLEAAPFAHRETIERLGDRSLLKVRVKLENTLDLTKETLSFKEGLKSGAIAGVEDNFAGFDTFMEDMGRDAQILYDVASGKKKDFMYPAAWTPDIFFDKIGVELKSPHDPNDLTKQLRAKGYDSIKYADDDVKVLDPDKIVGIGRVKPTTELDLQIGVPESPSKMSDSPFRETPDVTKGRSELYRGSESVGQDVEDIILNDLRDPEVTMVKLMNDVNRWLNGEGVDIANTRFFLDELDARVEEFRFRGYFADNQAAFEKFRSQLSDLAEWAGRVERNIPPMKAYGGGPSTEDIFKVVKGWLSKLRSVAEEKLPRIADGRQIKATLRKPVTGDEWRAVGLDELLKNDKRYTKEEVLKIIDENSVEFKDVLLGYSEGAEARRLFDKAREDYERRTGEEAMYDGFEGEEPTDLFMASREYLSIPERFRNDLEAYGNVALPGATRYGSYVEPGGENYRELFVTAPGIKSTEVTAGGYDWETGTEFDPNAWYDGHPDYNDIRNPIVRLRMNDRYVGAEPIPVTKNQAYDMKWNDPRWKPLIDNWESRARAGKSGQYAPGEIDETLGYIKSDPGGWYGLLRDSWEAGHKGNKVLFIEEMQAPLESTGDFAKMPKELSKRWREIGVKRALQEAVDGGYDYLAWTTGKMQNLRWNKPIRENIENVRWEKSPSIARPLNEIVKQLDARSDELQNTNRKIDELRESFRILRRENPYQNLTSLEDRIFDLEAKAGRLHGEINALWQEKRFVEEAGSGENLIHLHFKTKPGSTIQDFTKTSSANNLISTIGKGAASKILSGGNEGILSGEDIRIDLEKLYDDDIPNIVRKLGGEVKTIDVGIESLEWDWEQFKKFGFDEGYSSEIIDSAWVRRRTSDRHSSQAELLEKFSDYWLTYGAKNTKKVHSTSLEPFYRKQSLMYMYSGGPSTEQIVGAIKRGARAFKESMERDREAQRLGLGEIKGQTGRDLRRALIERSGNIEGELTSPGFYAKYGDIGFRAIRNMRLSKGSTPMSTEMYKRFAKRVYGGLNLIKSKIVDNLAMAVRMVDIGRYKTEKQFSFPEGKDPISSSEYLADFASIEGLTPEEAYDLYHENPDGTIGGRVGAGFEMVKEVLGAMRDEGLIGEKEYEDLIAHRYRRLASTEGPTTLAELLDEKYQATLGDIKRSVYDSGIEGLRKGRETDILEPSWKIMSFETMVRAYGRIAHNQANRMLLELARKDPENPYVRTKIRPTETLKEQPNARRKLANSIEIKRLERGISDYEIKSILKAASKGKSDPMKMTVDQLRTVDSALGPQSKGYTDKANKIPVGWIPTYLYEKGHRTTVWMEPEFAKEWVVNSKDITPRASRMIKWSTLAPITRMFATGIEPGFALANLPRDMLHLWFAARTWENGQWKSLYSPVGAKFVAELGTDLAEVSKDAMLRTGWWEDYIKYGGGMDFLVMQGRPFQKGLKIDSKVDDAFQVLGYLNESSEIVTRLAIMNRGVKYEAAKRGISVEEARKDPEIMRNAVYAARDYMDFAQGGWLTKLVDQAIPYLNASIVGMRTSLRSFKTGQRADQKAWWKLGQFAAMIAGLYVASKYWAPKTIEEVKKDIRTQNNIVIPMGDMFGFEDEYGQMRYPFIMIPLDPGMRAPKKFFEFVTDVMRGEDVDAQGTLSAIKQISPVDMATVPPLEAAIFEYFSNYDIYRDRQISSEKFSWPLSGAEYTKDTHPALIALGQKTGASPERIKVAMEEMISSNSVYSQILGGAYNKIFSQMPEDAREKSLVEALARFPVSKRFIGLTNPYTKFAETVEKSTEISAWRRHKERVGLDILVDGYLYKKSTNESWTDQGKFKTTRDGIERYMRSFNDQQTYMRLFDRLRFAERTQNMPHRTLWMKMQGQAVEARAKTYIDLVFNNQRMLAEFNQVNAMFKGTDKGLNTEGFRRAVLKLQGEAARENRERALLPGE